MNYAFKTDRSGQEWTAKDLEVLERATRQEIDRLARKMGVDPGSPETDSEEGWSWQFFEPSEKMVMKVAKQLRRLPGSIRAKIIQMSDEFFVDPIQLDRANRALEKMGRATKRKFVEDAIRSNRDLLSPDAAGLLLLDGRDIPPPKRFDEKKFIDDVVWEAKRKAREQALAILEAQSEQDDEEVKQRVRKLKRQLGIPPTAEEIRAATRERVRLHRQRKRSQDPVAETFHDMAR